MLEELSVSQAMVGSAAWLLSAAGVTLQWDGGSRAYRDVALSTVSEQAQPSSFRVKEALATAPRARPYWTTGEICLVPTVPSQVIAWDKEAARVTFSLTPVLLADTARGVIPIVTGELVWYPWQEQTASHTSSVHGVLLGHAPYESLQVERITIAPSLPVHDPLHHHIVLVLQAAVAAESGAERLYVAALVEALVVHFLRRYAASRASPHGGSRRAHTVQAAAHARLYQGPSGARVVPGHARCRGADEPHPFCAPVQACHWAAAAPVRDPVPDGARQAVAGRNRHAPHRDRAPGRMHGPKSLHCALSDTRLHDTQNLQRRRTACVRVTRAVHAPPKDILRSRGYPPDTACRQHADTTPLRRWRSPS